MTMAMVLVLVMVLVRVMAAAVAVMAMIWPARAVRVPAAALPLAGQCCSMPVPKSLLAEPEDGDGWVPATRDYTASALCETAPHTPTERIPVFQHLSTRF